MNIIKRTSGGYLKFYGKILDDFTNRYTGVAATDWENPKAAFGQDFNTTALMMPGFESNIPDSGRLDEGATNGFNPSQTAIVMKTVFDFQDQNVSGFLLILTGYESLDWLRKALHDFLDSYE